MNRLLRRAGPAWAALSAAVLGPVVLGACGGALSAPAPPAGLSADRPVPASVANLPLLDQAGRPTTLAAFHGRVLVLAPFLTSCQEECPLTTGAFLAIHSDLVRDHLAGRVSLAELTVDPGRDTPARLAAYARYTGADWVLLTGAPAVVSAFWGHFGIYYAPMPEGNPPGIDWQTGRPYTYDVSHANGFLIFDARGHQRFLTEDLPDLHGRLPAGLRRLLDGAGLASLAQPAEGAWTVPQALAAISEVLGRPVPAG